MYRICLTLALLLSLVSFSYADKKNEPWRKRNAAVVNQHNLTTRDRVIPQTDVPRGVEPGQTYELNDLPVIQIAPGVKASVAWGDGALLEILEMAPGSVYPQQQLSEELITVVQEGSAQCEFRYKKNIPGDQKVSLTKDTLIYLTPDTHRVLRAGPKGLKAIEVYSPVRIDHLKLAGAEIPSGGQVGFPDQGVTPSIAPRKIYNLNEIQWAGLTPPRPTDSYLRSGAGSRLVWGKNVMLSYVRMDPKSSFPLHIHPEDQLMIALRGSLVEGLMDYAYTMDGQKQHVVLQPGGMAHSAELSEFGADALDVFWPVRPDYIEKVEQQNQLYEQVIAPGTQAVKLAEGFTFSEGPTWLNGALYFSDMYFADHRKGNWTGSAKRSRLIRMTPDGSWRVLAAGMQTNGTIASINGNLLVCDMFGHRVVEMDPETGNILDTAFDSVDGKSIDGPNDLVMDAHGGIYVTDPQFTPEKTKSQPGKQVYYVAADGTASVVIPAGNFAMPNGVEISPDGKTFYVNNTWFQPGENFIWAYDVQSDGSLTNQRRFAMLNLTPEVLSDQRPEYRFDSRADGMAVDTDGRLYVCTLSGVQIFEPNGVYVGTIWCPQYPVSCTFGGRESDILYMVGESSVWSIQTKVHGFRLPQN